MAEEDLIRFLAKVASLQDLVRSLEAQPQRRQQLAACSHHNEVVQLARSWGFSIGTRWGDRGSDAVSAGQDNLLCSSCPAPGQERLDVLLHQPTWRLERIHSNGFSHPEDVWCEQQEHEWVLLLRGSARLRFADEAQERDLSAGDQLWISAGRRHRVQRTDPDPGTIWLTLLWTGEWPPG
ncbi:Nif11 domain/cupin domain-containing protein [Synechococcus sp. RSCCF101]|uniref:Nif11 domain/cupin domain-containing protein n=1 Tax=Synechococcus sp. RSCCF101 TaxID=2511069 RepID=UPI0012466347|nr:Nif11 domain/cupin domain-containing protein [Synechococcus sp. RSCCF101]QEY32060.1 Nif11 domain/cupin domain-containing protein [Synechococcus sp. RSCCF101]